MLLTWLVWAAEGMAELVPEKGKQNEGEPRVVSSVLASCWAMLFVPCSPSPCLTSDFHAAVGNRCLHSDKIPPLLFCFTAFSGAGEVHSTGKGRAPKYLKLPFPGSNLQQMGAGSWWIMPQPPFLESDHSESQRQWLLVYVHNDYQSVMSFYQLFLLLLLFLLPHSFFLELSFQINFIHLSPCLRLYLREGEPNWDKHLQDFKVKMQVRPSGEKIQGRSINVCFLPNGGCKHSSRWNHPVTRETGLWKKLEEQ